MNFMIFFSILSMFQEKSFKETQLVHSRVAEAYADKEKIVSQYFTDNHVRQSGFNLFLRGFKEEGKLEVWVKEKGKDQYVLLTTYDFCATSGQPGPKRKEGDGQIPEGIYYINHFNPLSNFFLSLGINYPNESDRLLSDRMHPGGSIYIHGNCVTIGCIPITDDKIKELYVLAVEARNNGQRKIPVHIFPFAKMNGAKALSQTYGIANIKFWENLNLIFQDFEKTKRLSSISVDNNGSYVISN